MGLKGRMMDAMMGGVSAEEKKKMMDSFFSNMSDAEKQGMMKDMMGQMMGGGGMMNMMSMMMGSKDSGSGESHPMEMCKKMMATMGKVSELATFATPEVRALFEEWAVQIEEELLKFIVEKGSSDPDTLARQFKLSRDSVVYFLTRLAQKGKIDLKAQGI